MLSGYRSTLPAGVALAALLLAAPAPARDVYKPFLDGSIPHHAAILDTLERLDKSPGDAQLHNDLGCLVAWDGFWRDALRSFEKASDLAPKDSRPWFNAGLVQALRGEWGAARSRFRKAVKVDPGNWPAWWMLGYAEEALGHDDAAVEAYARSLRVDTSLFDPKVNPFAVATRLKPRVLLETYERRRVDAALPFSNQIAEPSRVATFFQARAKAPVAASPADEPSQAGPVVTAVPPSSGTSTSTSQDEGRPAATPFPRRRLAYPRAEPRERVEPVDVAPEPPREEPPAQATPEGGAPAPGPGGADDEGTAAPGGRGTRAPGTPGTSSGGARRPPAGGGE